jgi:hypothetical protein
VENTNIYMYNVKGDNRLLPDLQLLMTESVLKILFSQSGSVIVFSIPEIVLLSSI